MSQESRQEVPISSCHLLPQGFKTHHRGEQWPITITSTHILCPQLFTWLLLTSTGYGIIILHKPWNGGQLEISDHYLPTDSVDMDLSKLWKTLEDKGASMLQSVGPQRVRHNLQRTNNNNLFGVFYWPKFSFCKRAYRIFILLCSSIVVLKSYSFLVIPIKNDEILQLTTASEKLKVIPVPIQLKIKCENMKYVWHAWNGLSLLI